MDREPTKPIIPHSVPDQPEHVQPPLVSVTEESGWEYKRLVVYLTAVPVPTVDDLNRLGADRWELCAGFTHEAFLHLYFKRPK